MLTSRGYGWALDFENQALDVENQALDFENQALDFEKQALTKQHRQDLLVVGL